MQFACVAKLVVVATFISETNRYTLFGFILIGKARSSINCGVFEEVDLIARNAWTVCAHVHKFSIGK